jgi:SAM-dependent methyltransferase
VAPWASLLDFVDLPEGCAVLCMGDDAPGMVLELQRRGHEGVLLVEEATPENSADGEALVVGRPHALPVPDGNLAAILCADVLHRQDNPEATLEELRRALRPGGLLVIHEPLAPEGSDGGYLSARELCAHLAGEQLVVMAHRQEPAGSGVSLATWVLQVPVSRPEKVRTYIEEDR